MAKRKRVFTEEQWDIVFRIRCRSKRGEVLSDQERALVEMAYKCDKNRYAETEADVFDNTVPFGSSAKRRK